MSGILRSGNRYEFDEAGIRVLSPSGETLASIDVLNITGARADGYDVTISLNGAGPLILGLDSEEAAQDLAARVASVVPSSLAAPPVAVASMPHIPIRHMSGTDVTPQVQEAARAVSGVLTEAEEILYIAMQDHRAPTVKKHAVVATTNRLILYRPQMVGSFNFSDSQWQDVKKVHLKQGMMFSDFTVERIDGSVDTIDKLNKEHGRKVYAIAQRFEQEWRENRRQRTMEEERARAGGVTIQGGYGTPYPPQPPAAPAPAPAIAEQSSNDPVARLAKAKTLMDQGLIGEDEYNALKARIISEI